MKPRILLVEDSDTNCFALTQMFTDAGFLINTAKTILAAKATIARENFDGIVVDYWLSDGEGIDLIKFLRADPRTASVPVVLVSASSRDFLENIRSKVNVPILQKPATVPDMLEKLGLTVQPATRNVST
jgi:two-component system sensor histidine kinase/response regulator